jgi:DNA adenine methylase
VKNVPRGSEARRQAPHTEDPDQPRPFLKWAGGKTQLLPQLRPLLPPRDRIGRYFEPFVGSAALFFALRPRRAVLSDVNRELVSSYRAIKNDVEGVIRELRAHVYGAEHYYRVRDEVRPASLSPTARAARTIYLNKTCFNGLYRVNRAGRFNVPFGRYTNPSICDADNLRACSLALRHVELAVRDFSDVAKHARAGDFVYFDPPYVPLSDTSDFTSYIPGGFGAAEQQRLAKVFAQLAQSGVHVMLSNSDTPPVRSLYARFHIHPVLASRSINSKITKRGKVGEVVVTSYDPA